MSIEHKRWTNSYLHGTWTAAAVFSAVAVGMAAGGFRLADEPGDGPERVMDSSAMWMHGAAPQAMPPAEIVGMLDEVAPTHIRYIIDRLVSFGTRHTLSDAKSETRGIGAARRWIKSEFDLYAADSGRSEAEAMKVYFDRHVVKADGRRITEDVDLVNVVAEIPGSDPSSAGRRYYVLGHYDSRNSSSNDAEGDAPGANDDGSGVALLMELARVMSKHRFEATLVFMATAGEEQGLYGAKMHAEAAREAGMDIRAVLSNDIVGDPTDPLAPDEPQNGFVRVFSTAIPQTADAREIARIRSLGGEVDSPSRQLARYIAEVRAQYYWNDIGGDGLNGESAPVMVVPRVVFRTDRFLRGGDHTAFNRAGFTGVRFSEMAENYHRQHQDVRVEEGVEYGDLPEFVDENYLAGVVRLNMVALAHLANAPSVPTNVRIITSQLENKTRLRWDASPESDVAGYEVVWRDTAMPFWQGAVDVGLETEAVIGKSKDLYLFGVRAYDADGYRSPVMFAGAGRR